MKETDKIYKLATLYMLSRCDIPISTNHLSLFLLKNNYTDYFTFQQGLGELVNDGWVDTADEHGRTMYLITDKGRSALGLLINEISSSMKKDIEDYIKENRMALREDFSVKSGFYKNDMHQFISNLTIDENGKRLLEINISSSSEDAAERICTNWKNSSDIVYPMLVEMLMKQAPPSSRP